MTIFKVSFGPFPNNLRQFSISNDRTGQDRTGWVGKGRDGTVLHVFTSHEPFMNFIFLSYRSTDSKSKTDRKALQFV